MNDIFTDSHNKNKNISSFNNISDNANKELNEMKSNSFQDDEISNNFNDDS